MDGLQLFFMLLYFSLIYNCQSSLDSWQSCRIQVANVTQIVTCLQQKNMTWNINECKNVHNTTSVKSNIHLSSELLQNKMGAWNNCIVYDVKIYLTNFCWLWSLNIYALVVLLAKWLSVGTYWFCTVIPGHSLWFSWI